MQIFKQEGIRGFYRGLSASYLGVAESALHLVLYERIKEISQSSVDIPQKVSDCKLPSHHTPWPRILSYLGIGGSAGIAKLIAGVIAYPHEVSERTTCLHNTPIDRTMLQVIRTRLRQAPLPNGQLKYTSLIQCSRTIWKEEGVLAFYGGITPHMLRAVPSAAMTLGVYEAVLHYLR
jgi:solute carrier family 25 protein 33/36